MKDALKKDDYYVITIRNKGKNANIVDMKNVKFQQKWILNGY